MRKFEYKVHTLRYGKQSGQPEEHLVRELNSLGRQGWRLHSLSPDLRVPLFSSWSAGVNMLLERELDGEAEFADYPRG